MKFENEDVSIIWTLSGQDRIQAFEAAFRLFGPRMFAFPSFFKTEGLIQKCVPLLNSSVFKSRAKTIKTIAFYYFTYGFGGVERCISYLMPLFQQLGYRVIFITDIDASSDAYPMPKDVVRLVFGKENDRTQPFENLQKRCLLWKEFIEAYHIDAIYYAYSSNNIRMLDFPVIRSCGAYLIYHFHAPFSHHLVAQGSKYFFDFSSLIRFADTMIGLSRTDECFFRLCQCRAHYIPNKCFFDVMPEKKSEDTCPRLTCLWCGRLAPQKQPLEIIPIFAKICTRVPTAKLIILGDESDAFKKLKFKEKMHQQAIILGCEKAIEWAGFQQDVDSYYERADVLISTSQFEGFPLAFIESCAYGLPIVSYAMPYLEILRDGLATKSVPQRDHQAAADAVVELLTTPEVYRKASRAARKMAEYFMRFDQAAAWKKVIEELPESYTPQESDDVRMNRVMLETILLHGTWSQMPLRTTQQLNTVRKQLKSTQAQLAKLKKTLTWRIGHFVLFLPKKLKGGVKCLRDNGFRYTFRHGLKKIFKRFKR